MTAGEHQAQALVCNTRDHRFLRLRLLVVGLARDQLRGAPSEHAITPEAIDRVVARNGHDPREGIVGHASARPALHGGREGVLDRVLGEVPVAGCANERGDRPPELFAEQAVDGAGTDRSVQDAARPSSAAAARAA
jgi:hypothetical protein